MNVESGDRNDVYINTNRVLILHVIIVTIVRNPGIRSNRIADASGAQLLEESRCLLSAFLSKQ